MKLEVYNKPYPECPHLFDGRCTKLSAALSREIPVTSSLCNLVCKSGAAFGQPPSRARLIDSAHRTYLRLRGLPVYNKVREKYAGVDPIGIPQWWSELQLQLAPLYELPFIKEINISGSALWGSLPINDIDIVIQIYKWEPLKAMWADFKGLLPAKLLGVNAEYFINREWYGLYAQLDCENKILHCPSRFKIEGRELRNGVRAIVHDDIQETELADQVSKHWSEFRDVVEGRAKSKEIALETYSPDITLRMVATADICRSCSEFIGIEVYGNKVDQLPKTGVASCLCKKLGCQSCEKRVSLVAGRCPIGKWDATDLTKPVAIQ